MANAASPRKKDRGPARGSGRSPAAAPAARTWRVLVAPPEPAALQVAELVEHEQGMVAGAAEVAVVGRALLIAMGLALGTVHVEDEPSGGFRPCTRSIEAPDRSISTARLAPVVSLSVSKRATWLVEAAVRSIISRPTTALMAGSRGSRSASLSPRTRPVDCRSTVEGDDAE